MHYLALSIFCSVCVSVLLKIARAQNIHIAQAITVNYGVATLLCLVILRPPLHTLDLATSPIWLFISLGLLLPVGFLVIAQAVQRAGIVRSDAAQRLSLFLPLLAAPLLFGEHFNQQKLIGISIAVIALLGLLYVPKKKEDAAHAIPYAGLFLLLTWLCYGTVDVLFKQLSKTGLSFSSGLTVIFILAGAIMGLILCLQKTVWNRQSLSAGLLLGLLNFGNIYFYIKAHQHYAENPSIVFASMNIGVIALGTIVGAGFFKEKLYRLNMLGVLLAIVAVYIMIPR